LLRRASLFVHTSRWDGLPFSVLEALAAGRPVLVTPGTNTSEYVRSAAAGEVVEADAASIAAGLRRACSWSAAERTNRAVAARRLVETRFRWPDLARQMAETYKSVVASPRS
jgi:glycosyltransferase involved in cell wall biosynthesis